MRLMYSILTCIIATWTYGAEVRTWTSQGGKTIEAEFIRAGNGRVLLRGIDGKMMNTSFNALSKEDQAFITQLYKDMQEKIKAEAIAADEKVATAKADRQAEVLAKWKRGSIVSCVTTGKVQTSYHVYIPATFDPDKPPPLVYAFSPGGNGKGQLNSMKQSAEKVGWIVVGCDKLKNGMDDKVGYEIEDAIFEDVQATVPHDSKRVFLSGMSGGAMRSYDIAARRHDIQFVGILAFGGWLGGAERQKELVFPKSLVVAIINGNNDNNANAWVESDSKALKRYKRKVKYFTFPGGHTMAPTKVIDEAIAWMQTQSLPK